MLNVCQWFYCNHNCVKCQWFQVFFYASVCSSCSCHSPTFTPGSWLDWTTCQPYSFMAAGGHLTSSGQWNLSRCKGGSSLGWNLYWPVGDLLELSSFPPRIPSAGPRRNGAELPSTPDGHASETGYQSSFLRHSYFGVVYYCERTWWVLTGP